MLGKKDEKKPKAAPKAKPKKKPAVSSVKKELADLEKLVDSLESVREKQKHYPKLEELRKKAGLDQVNFSCIK